MSYLDTIRRLRHDPEQLELTYQEALTAGEADAFGEAIDTEYAEAEDDVLLAAWHYRLLHAAESAKGRLIAWGWVIPLAVLNGALLWLLSDLERFAIRVTNPLTDSVHDILPAVALLAAPVSAVVAIAFLTVVGDRRWSRALAVVAGLSALCMYVLLIYDQLGTRAYQEQYVILMVIHLALAAWLGVGLLILDRRSSSGDVFAFLIKSLEFVVVAGLFAIVGGVFTGITLGLFEALGVQAPEVVQRLFVAGGAGAIVVLALALVYDPTAKPAQQSFDEGLSKLVAMLMRLLLPLAVIVLLVYVAFIPFNAREPFENRDVLIAFNAMLFGVVGLLIGATPVKGSDLGAKSQTWLRRGLVALAVLAIVVSVYALAAILYRTAIDRLTPNRLAIIGWNVVNIGLLCGLLLKQWRSGRDRWLPGMHETFAAAMVPYAAWALVIILAVPWLFGIGQADVKQLPTSVQQVVYEQPSPVLLKCPSSPHIYLLEDAEKRWIEDIPTFEDRGYEWRDVKMVPCDDLNEVPDGEPIPEDAGPPPSSR